MSKFGSYIRKCREKLREGDARYSLRQVAGRIKVEPSYLSKVERGDEAPPSEPTIRRLAEDFSEDPDVLLGLAGKVSEDLQVVIRKRPKLFAELIRQLKKAPDKAVLRICRDTVHDARRRSARATTVSEVH